MNDIVNDLTLTHLRPAETRLAAILARPKAVAIACIVALAALGWTACGLRLSGTENSWPSALCLPAPGHALSATEAPFILAMWVTMTLAMMLPAAGPMILTYAEIADTAARKEEQAVSPIVLIAGYAAVWLGFALAATSLQMLLVISTPSEISAVPWPLAGAIILATGVYQFSKLKQACLRLCQRPFPFFFANWTAQSRGVFRLGLRQGLYCLGCCWALMLVMFAVGAMNVLWMATLGALMTIEKMSTTARFARAVGVAFIAIGLGLIAMEYK